MVQKEKRNSILITCCKCHGKGKITLEFYESLQKAVREK